MRYKIWDCFLNMGMDELYGEGRNFAEDIPGGIRVVMKDTQADKLYPFEYVNDHLRRCRLWLPVIGTRAEGIVNIPPSPLSLVPVPLSPLGIGPLP